ncbi:ZIP family metal transporter [Leptospira venezuelensis]|uniref:ZIP family metal transporter n=1 Tax=Leptospira venezuelensis TaxID=1958811 RepID=UPI000A3914A4|nr:ZIP family metal transporter [Leptospira venezuelensis]
MSSNIIFSGFLASLAAGLCTGLGAAGVFAIRQLSTKLEDGLLSFAAGIMLSASFFSLLLPALEIGEIHFQNKSSAAGIVILGLLFGVGILFLIHKYSPHEHFISGKEGPDTKALSRIWLFVVAITLHNFPEGMAVGVGIAGDGLTSGLSLATGIGIQNIPEGLAVAVSLLSVKYSKLQSFTIAFLTGLIEPIGGLVGSFAVSIAGPMMPWTMGFAAGAMLFIIVGEIIPETHKRGFHDFSALTLIFGFVFMMYLDTIFG